jgi:hypothetical protein
LASFPKHAVSRLPGKSALIRQHGGCGIRSEFQARIHVFRPRIAQEAGISAQNSGEIINAADASMVALAGMGRLGTTLKVQGV